VPPSEPSPARSADAHAKLEHRHPVRSVGVRRALGHRRDPRTLPGTTRGCAMNETITITGNVATEPEHKLTPGGVSITTFRIASGQRRYDRQTGGWVDGPTNWYSVSTFRSLADHAYDSLHKGDRVILTGRLKVREWETS